MPRNTRLSPNFILHVLQNGGVENVFELTQHSPKIKLDKTSNILENHPFSSSNLRFHCLLLFYHTFLLHALRHLLCTRKEKINMDEERERRERRMEKGWDGWKRRGWIESGMRRTEWERKGAREDGSVFADPLSAASAPDPASPFPVARTASPPPAAPSAPGWFGVERQAARGR